MVRGAEAYRRVDTESRSPVELVVMLYDGAIRFVGDASTAAQRNDVRGRTQAVSRALAIVTELQNTLKVDEGGDMARELDRLYSYMATRLLDVNTKKDAGALDEVHRLLTTVRDAWAQIGVPVGARP